MSAPHRDPRLLVVVFAGGCVGTTARWGLSSGLDVPRGSFPWTTLLINLAGALVLGALLEALAARGPDTGVRRLLRLGVGTGVLGGFTTYSTFMVETTGLALPAAAAYVVVTVVIGVVAALTGQRLTRRILAPNAPATAEVRR